MVRNATKTGLEIYDYFFGARLTLIINYLFWQNTTEGPLFDQSQHPIKLEALDGDVTKDTYGRVFYELDDPCKVFRDEQVGIFEFKSK